MKSSIISRLISGLAIALLLSSVSYAATQNLPQGTQQIGKGADKVVFGKTTEPDSAFLTPADKRGAEETLRKEKQTGDQIAANFKELTGTEPQNLAVKFEEVPQAERINGKYTLKTPRAVGDLGQYIDKNSKTLSLTERVNLVTQYGNGMAQLNESGFSFGDAKPGNSLVTMARDQFGNVEPVVQLSDFGKTKAIQFGVDPANKGNTRYLAPEAKNSAANDSWALAGVIMQGLGGSYEAEVVKAGIGIDQSTIAGKIKRLAFEVQRVLLGGKTDKQIEEQVQFMRDHNSQMIEALKQASPEHADALDKIKTIVDALTQKNPNDRMTTTEASVQMANAFKDMAQTDLATSESRVNALRANPNTKATELREAEHELAVAKLKAARVEVNVLQAEGLKLASTKAEMTLNEQQRLANRQAGLAQAKAAVEVAANQVGQLQSQIREPANAALQEEKKSATRVSTKPTEGAAESKVAPSEAALKAKGAPAEAVAKPKVAPSEASIEMKKAVEAGKARQVEENKTAFEKMRAAVQEKTKAINERISSTAKRAPSKATPHIEHPAEVGTKARRPSVRPTVVHPE